MAKKDEEPAEPPIVPHWEIPSLLSSIPPTDPAVLKAFEDGRLSHKHYSAIGQVAARWAYFEGVMDTWLMIFAGIETEIGVCFTAQMLGSRPRIDGFIALVRYLGANKKWNERLEEFAKDAQGLGEQRNRAVHDVWDMSESSSPRRLEATARRLVRVLKVHVPTNELLRLAENIEALRKRFDDLASAIFTEIHTSPGTTPPSTPP